MRKPKVYWNVCPYYGPSVQAVGHYYKKFGSDFVDFVDDYLDCDIAVLQLIGEPDRENLVTIKERGFSDEVNSILDLAESGVLDVVALPLCNVNGGSFFTRLFRTAILTNSYLNLPEYADVEYRNRVRAPIGVDPNFFYEEDGAERPFVIYSFGYDEKTESFAKIYEAVAKFNERAKLPRPYKMLHSGRDFGYNEKYYQFVPPAGLGDFDAVRKRYLSCWFASGLREDAVREGGFEQANVEAPLCGTIPIAYDLECFTHWFHDISLFVGLDTVVDDLVDIFDSRFKLLPSELNKKNIAAKSKIYDQFTWHKISHNFWQEVIKGEQ
jgi:hypothetical protein